MVSDRRASAGDDHIGIARTLKRSGQRFKAVGHRADTADRACEPGAHRHQHRAVARRDAVGGKVGRIVRQLVAAVEHGHRRPAMDRELRIAGCDRERELARTDPGAGGQQRVAQPEIEPGAADVTFGGLAFAVEAQGVAVARGVLLQQHRVRAVRHQRTGRDPHRLARPDHAGERMPGRALADQPPRPGFAEAQRVAVHRREIGRGLGPPGEERFGEAPPERIGHRHGFCGERGDACQQPRLRIGELERGGHFAQRSSAARHSPDLPPLLASSRTPSITMPLSSALAMS